MDNDVRFATISCSSKRNETDLLKKYLYINNTFKYIGKYNPSIKMIGGLLDIFIEIKNYKDFMHFLELMKNMNAVHECKVSSDYKGEILHIELIEKE